MNILCPICKNPLIKENACYKCINRHSYDLSKEGYLNLNTHPSKNSGDEKQMIRARSHFPNKDCYAFLKKEIDQILVSNNSQQLIDLACGEGYYTSYFHVKDKIGIDLSKEGLKLAAKKDKSSFYLLASIFNTCLEDHCADSILTCFAPLAKEEVGRLLKKDGIFIFIKPGARHLFELKEAVYDKAYLNKEEIDEIAGFDVFKSYEINDKRILDNETIKELFMMTPYSHKTARSDIEKLDMLDDLAVTFSFIITIYKKM